MSNYRNSHDREFEYSVESLDRFSEIERELMEEGSRPGIVAILMTFLFFGALLAGVVAYSLMGDTKPVTPPQQDAQVIGQHFSEVLVVKAISEADLLPFAMSAVDGHASLHSNWNAPSAVLS